MDPDANLKEQRAIAQEILKHLDNGDLEAMQDFAGRLAELVVALDEWITRGGFLPKDWRRE